MPLCLVRGILFPHFLTCRFVYYSLWQRQSRRQKIWSNFLHRQKTEFSHGRVRSICAKNKIKIFAPAILEKLRQCCLRAELVFEYYFQKKIDFILLEYFHKVYPASHHDEFQYHRGIRLERL